MKQVHRFYLASFLKNQTYFVPVIVLFFQDLGLSYSEIFWIFTIGSVFSFIIEIPTGVIADLFGNRKSVILSKFLIFVSFVLFGFADGFIALLAANLLYELGKSFRSGTETAYVFNYLSDYREKEMNPPYTKIKINQKFYARVSEAGAALLGGYIAYEYGFSYVFFAAALPSFVNFIQSLTWEKLSFEEQRGFVVTGFKDQYFFIKQSLREVFKNRKMTCIILNISFFTTGFAALDKFTQPYMKTSGLDLKYFGVIYSGFLILIAFFTKMVSGLAEKVGEEKFITYSGFAALVPLTVLSFRLETYWSIGLFFLVLMIDNLRSPVANQLFHEQVRRENRATMGSILEIFKSVNKIWFLPFIGYMADIKSMYMAMIFIAGLLLVNALLFRVRK